jgi:hypothetical protein
LPKKRRKLISDRQFILKSILEKLKPILPRYMKLKRQEGVTKIK